MSTSTRRQFLLTSAALAATGPAVAAKSTATLTGTTWTNWPANIAFTHGGAAFPSSVDEVAELIRRASHVKAVGAGHSYNASPATTGTVVSLPNSTALRHLNADLQEVWIEGGQTIRNANQALAEQGLMLASLPGDDHPTLAGAVSTATHGSGMTWGSLSDGDSLLGLELVDGTGTVHTMEIEDDRLAAARVGLGALGIITALKMRVRPIHNLRVRRKVVTETEGMDPQQWARNDHYELFWVPFADRFFTLTRNKTDQVAEGKGIGWDDWVRTASGLVKKSARRPEDTPTTMSRLAGSIASAEIIAPADRAMTSDRLVRGFTQEFALPMAQFSTGFRAVQDLTEDWASSGRFYLNLPVQCRFTRGDRGTLLSPAQGRSTAFVKITTDHRYADWQPFFAAVEGKLRALGGRPHWGKVFESGNTDAYPEFARWEAVRAQLDPEGKFLNPWLDKLRST